MKKFIYVIALLQLAGCAQLRNAALVELEDAQTQSGIFLSCSSYKAWQHCYKAAEKSCPSGYHVISRDENVNTQSRVLRIECTK
jgi:hypothetical protein